MDALDAAEIVLREAGQPLHYREITERALNRGIWSTTGKTPAATVNARIAVDIQDHGDESRFIRVAPGMFAIRDKEHTDRGVEGGARAVKQEAPPAESLSEGTRQPARHEHHGAEAAEGIRCLAVRQPMAWALVAGAKDIENRSWTTSYRGPVVIQASSSKADVNRHLKEGWPPLHFAFGALVGVVDLVDVVPLSEELEANPWAWGPHCWRIANARVFKEPIPCKGKLNLYTLPAEMTERTRAAIEAAVPLDRDAPAQEWLTRLVSHDQDFRLACLFENYLALDDTADALRIAEKRVALGRNVESVTDLARARLVVGRLDEALVDVNEAIISAPENARAYFVRGLVYEDLAGRDKAKAGELDPGFALADSTTEEEETPEE